MIVITGAAGQLGTSFTKTLGVEAVALTRNELDLTDIEGIGPTLLKHEPSVIINCAAYTAVDDAEKDRETAHTVNTVAVGELAASAADLGARLVTFSTDYVFDGTKDSAYVESDEPNPINVYGNTKLEGERRALDANPDVLVIRTAWLMSGTHPNFAATMLRLIAEGSVSVVDDQRGHPTFVDDLVAATLAAADADASGILHLTNSGTTNWYSLAREIAQLGGLDVERIRPTTAEEFSRPARRPANSVLDSERLDELGLAPLPDYHESLRRVVGQLTD